MSFALAKQVIDQAVRACIGCGACTGRCAVLEERDASGALLPVREGGAGKALVGGQRACVRAATVGEDAPTTCAPMSADEAGAGMTVGSLASLFSLVENAEDVAAVASAHPAVVFAARRCFMCGYCTLKCPTNVDARGMFTALRELFSLGGVVDDSGFTMTQVDKEWHCFSAYRAVYGIWYVDLPQIEDAPALGADTLFFPGCPLASYSPDLTRQAFAWLQENAGSVVFTDACCGSPLKTAGYGDRADAYKKSLVERMIAAGIHRVVCVCPGCAEELAAAAAAQGAALEMVALPQLLADAGVRVSAKRARELVAQAAAEVREASGATEAGEAVASNALSHVGESAGVQSDASEVADVCAAASASKTASETAVEVCIAPFDSCHDREGVFGGPLRMLLQAQDVRVVEMLHHGTNALCCGGAGAVSLVDPAIKEQRIDYLLKDEAAQTGAELLVSNCPTCTYTAAQKRRADIKAGRAVSKAVPCNYMELIFPGRFDWNQVFDQLEGMWSGQYAAWVRSVLL